MTKVLVTASFSVTPAELWERIGNVASLSDWHPGIPKVAVEGAGAGAIRTCQLANGATLRERIDAVDDAGRSYSYSMLEGPLPVKGYAATLRVRDGDDGGSVAEWSSEFEVTGGDEAELVARIQTVYEDGFAQVKNLLGGADAKPEAKT